jgi:hypothetical protein
MEVNLLSKNISRLYSLVGIVNITVVGRMLGLNSGFH